MFDANKEAIGPMVPSSTHHFESFTVTTVTEYLCQKWPRICSVCRNHNSVLSSFMNYHRFCNKSNTTGATSGTATAYPSEAPAIIFG